jgi:hypothetical protein
MYYIKINKILCIKLEINQGYTTMHGQIIIKGNFSSIIIINTNGEDCPVDPNDNKW